MAELVAYTDGGCRGNPGIGGWGFVLIDPRTCDALERGGGSAHTTNNRMEMQAAIEALSAIERTCRSVVVRTDSLYLLKSCSLWLPGWKQLGWRRKDGPLLNIDLLQRLDELQSRHRVRWEWVRGHAGDVGNEHADRLASEAIDRIARGDPPPHERRFQWTATPPGHVPARVARARRGRPEHLPSPMLAAIPAPAAPSPEDDELRAKLVELLRRHQGNVSATARAMDKAPVQIRRWCRRLGIQADEFRR